MPKPENPIVARPKRPPSVLICAKCLKQAEEGRAVRKALKAGLAEAPGRRPGKLVATRCMGLCPKRAVALASGASLARGELLVVGCAAHVPAALALLLP